MNYLNDVHGDEWLRTNGPKRWPPRSPDLKSLDFELWSTLKNKFYSTGKI